MSPSLSPFFATIENESGWYLAGTVADIKEGKAEVKSKKGNTISKNGTEDDPAVVIEREGVSSSIFVWAGSW